MAMTLGSEIMEILYAHRDVALHNQKAAPDLGDALIYRHRAECLNAVIREAQAKIDANALLADDEVEQDETPYWDTDAAHDSYVLASAGYGTDEDYGFGGYGGFDDYL